MVYTSYPVAQRISLNKINLRNIHTLVLKYPIPSWERFNITSLSVKAIKVCFICLAELSIFATAIYSYGVLFQSRRSTWFLFPTIVVLDKIFDTSTQYLGLVNLKQVNNNAFMFQSIKVVYRNNQLMSSFSDYILQFLNILVMATTFYNWVDGLDKPLKQL